MQNPAMTRGWGSIAHDLLESGLVEDRKRGAGAVGHLNVRVEMMERTGGELRVPEAHHNAATLDVELAARPLHQFAEFLPHDRRKIGDIRDVRVAGDDQ